MNLTAIRRSATAECRKLFRRRAILPIYFGLALLTIVIGTVTGRRHVQSSAATHLYSGFELMVFFLGVVAICISANYAASEYSYATVRNLLVRIPQRSSLLAGKFLGIALYLTALTFAIYLVAAICAIATAPPLIRRSWLVGRQLIDSCQALGSADLGILAFAAVGFCLGILLRSSILAISIALLWSLIVESAIGAIYPRALPWLPAGNIENISQWGSAPFTYQHSLLLGGATLLLLGTPAVALFARRDIS
jgi:ABC-type transport system involved in multi-copper enzyme maturation permease subunit